MMHIALVIIKLYEISFIETAERPDLMMYIDSIGFYRKNTQKMAKLNNLISVLSLATGHSNGEDNSIIYPKKMR